MEELRTNSQLLPTARKQGDAILLALRGEIDLHNSPQIRTVVLDLIQKHKPLRIVFNVDGVAYMDSSGIAVLVEALKKLKPTGGKIYLTNVQPRVRGLLEIARLDTVFNLVSTEEEALK
jgi:anti-sigma B factor antagonist